MSKYRGMNSALPLTGWRCCLLINLNTPNQILAQKWQSTLSPLVRAWELWCCIRSENLLRQKPHIQLACLWGCYFSWISNLETRRTPRPDSSTSFQEQKEGTRSRNGKKKFGMPLASRVRRWLWMCNSIEGDFYFKIQWPLMWQGLGQSLIPSSQT